MRTRAGLGLLLVAALGSGCDTTQPLQVQNQNVEISFQAPNAKVLGFLTFDVFEDSDLDGAPDDVNADGVPDKFLWCEPLASTADCNTAVSLGQPTENPGSVPWSFSVQIEVLHAGATVPETLVRTLTSGESFAAYDTEEPEHNAILLPQTVQHRRGECSLKPAILCNGDSPVTTVCDHYDAGVCRLVGSCSGDPNQACYPNEPGQPSCGALGLGSCLVETVTRTFRFADSPKRRLSAANREVLLSKFNIFYDTDPAKALATFSGQGSGSSGGLCPGQDFGPAHIGDEPLPFSLRLDKGDTLTVEARRFDTVPAGISFCTEPTISAQFSLEGAPADVQGSTATQANAESFIQFHFTLQ